MFIESHWIGEKENPRGGAVYVKLMDNEGTVLLGEFGITSEAGYITRKDDDWIFEAAVRDDEDIDKPPFRRVCEVKKDELRELLKGERFFYGAAIREAWDNWSEGDILRFRIEDDDRQFEADHKRLMEYERGY